MPRDDYDPHRRDRHPRDERNPRGEDYDRRRGDRSYDDRAHRIESRPIGFRDHKSSRDDRHSSRHERRLSPASERRAASPPKKTPSPVPAEGEKKKKKKKDGSKSSPKDGKEKKKKKEKKKRKKESESDEEESGVATKKKKKSKKLKKEKGGKKVSVEKASNEIDEVLAKDEALKSNEAAVAAAEEHSNVDAKENIVEENRDEIVDQPDLELKPVISDDPTLNVDIDVAKAFVPEVEEEKLERDEFDESDDDDEHLTLHHDENDLVIFTFILFS